MWVGGGAGAGGGGGVGTGVVVRLFLRAAVHAWARAWRVARHLCEVAAYASAFGHAVCCAVRQSGTKAA